MEQWKDIQNYEGQYQISDLGRVKSLARVVTIFQGIQKKLPEIIMKQYPHVRGYKTVWLRRPCEHNKQFVHILVAKAFIPNPDNLPVVNHRKGDKTDNRASELEWISYSGNTHHYYRHRREAELRNDSF